MNVNFIISNHDQDAYIPHLVKIIEGFKVINPNGIICHSGPTDPDFHYLRCENHPKEPFPRMHSFNHWNKVKQGYEKIKGMGNTRYISLCSDSWLCDENAIIKIFNRMEQLKCGYGGNWWNNEFQVNPMISSDIFFADTRFGNIFEAVEPDEREFETWLHRGCVRKGIGIYIIHKREPVYPNHRHVCEALKWTMEHELDKNIANARKWGIVNV